MTVNKNQDLVRLGEKKDVLPLLKSILSYPPLQTYHFNEDGTNYYHSPSRIFFLLPIFMAVFILFILEIVPLFLDIPVESKLEI